MNYRIIGAVLIILACGGFGFLTAASYRRELKLLRQIVYMTELMQSELSYQMTPLPELCKMVGKMVGGTVHKVLSALSEELERQIRPDAQSCMYSALSTVDNLPRSAERMFAKLGNSLGQFDLSGQLNGFEAVKQSCNRILLNMEENREHRLRSYRTLGLCAGAALVILFI